MEPPRTLKSSKATTSALMKPRSKSEWITPAAYPPQSTHTTSTDTEVSGPRFKTHDSGIVMQIWSNSNRGSIRDVCVYMDVSLLTCGASAPCCTVQQRTSFSPAVKNYTETHTNTHRQGQRRPQYHPTRISFSRRGISHRAHLNIHPRFYLFLRKSLHTYTLCMHVCVPPCNSTHVDEVELAVADLDHTGQGRLGATIVRQERLLARLQTTHNTHTREWQKSAG
jgi:hypothetical protein